jgi:hypothetical protein
VLVASYEQRPDLAARLDEVEDVWPEFIHHAQCNRCWPLLSKNFPQFQLVCYDEEADAVIGKGQTVPFRWDGTLEDLPDGVEGVMQRVFEEGGAATALSALVAVIGRSYHGRGLSRQVISGMCDRPGDMDWTPWSRPCGRR